MNLLICYGTRPEWIKIKPLVGKISGKIPYKLLFTGQHKDIAAGNFDYKMEVKFDGNRLDSIFSSVFSQFESYVSDITHVLVQGDTATACAIALAAFHRKIPVIHLEAGLRTYDTNNPYPEESYRQMISSITAVHLCPTINDKEHLEKERKYGPKYVVGNTVLDNLIDLEPTYGNFVMVTMHRRENHKIMDQWFKEISKLALSSDLEFILPIHPNPNVQQHKHLLKGVTVIDPLSYEEMKQKLSNCRFIITDSGGIQEEASFLKKYVIVCRDKTERESFGTVMCKEPKDLEKYYNHIMKCGWESNYKCPFGDGNASGKILEILEEINKNG